MNSLYKICSWVLMMTVLTVSVPAVARAAQGPYADRSDGITKNLPEKLATPEESIPTSKKWWWWAAAALAVGIGAAAAGGGDSGGTSSTGTSTGSVAVGW